MTNEDCSFTHSSMKMHHQVEARVALSGFFSEAAPPLILPGGQITDPPVQSPPQK